MNQKLQALYGLKWNPFSPDLPDDALWVNPQIEHFCWRLQNQVRYGGFSLITGEPGTGKSVALRVVSRKLSQLPDVSVGVVIRPQSHLGDFYRELGDLFSVALSPHNRWCGFNSLSSSSTMLEKLLTTSGLDKHCAVAPSFTLGAIPTST